MEDPSKISLVIRPILVDKLSGSSEGIQEVMLEEEEEYDTQDQEQVGEEKDQEQFQEHFQGGEDLGGASDQLIDPATATPASLAVALNKIYMLMREQHKESVARFESVGGSFASFAKEMREGISLIAGNQESLSGQVR